MAAIMGFITGRDRRPPQVLTPEQNILKQWQLLASRDPKSADRRQIAALVDDERNREIALRFKGKDAATVLNTIDKVLKGDQISHTTRSHAFKLMRKLAGASRQVPKSYLVGIFLRCKVKKVVIASGGFADIRKGRFMGMDVAVRTLRTSLESDVDAIHEAFCKECVVLMNISHPNILQLLAVKMKPEAREFSMISEMMANGHIIRYIDGNSANRIRLLEDVAKGLEYLHKCGIIHGDLKGPNILINNETPPRACISDFGLSAIVPSRSFGDTRADPGGTFGHMAPELLSEGAKPSKEADMYAFGMVVYEVVTGVRPYGQRGLWQLPVLTVKGLRPSRPEDPVSIGFGQGTWEFAEQCWNESPTQRPTARAALEHFECVARTSTVVGPGPTIPIHRSAGEAPSRLGSSSKGFSQLFAQQINSPTSGEPNMLNRMHPLPGPSQSTRRVVESPQSGP